MNRTVKPLIIFLIAFSLAFNLLIGLQMSDQTHFSLNHGNLQSTSMRKHECENIKCDCNIEMQDEMMELVRTCSAYMKNNPQLSKAPQLERNGLNMELTQVTAQSSYQQVMQQLHEHGNRYSLFFPGLKQLVSSLESLSGRDDQVLSYLQNFLVESISAKAKEEGKELDGWLRGNRAEYAKRFAASPLVDLICETGFNFGYSSIMWLYSNPNAQLFEFGQLETDYMKLGRELVQLLFGDRFIIVEGDSTVKIPEIVSQFAGKIVCDIVHIDGGHTGDTPLKDLEGLRNLSDSDTLVLVDDCGTCSYCGGPQRAWNIMKDRKMLREIQCIDTIMDGGLVQDHKWCIGKYIFDP